MLFIFKINFHNMKVKISNTFKDLQKQATDLFCKKGILKKIVEFTGKNVGVLFSNKVSGVMAASRSSNLNLFPVTPMQSSSFLFFRLSTKDKEQAEL